MNIGKTKLSFSQIINMNVGFFGIQYSFGLQQTAVNPIYDFLGANPDQIPFLNLAGPMTGLFIQPIIGALSDKTWSPRWGRRKPYFLIGAILCSICLFVFPFSSSLWMAAGLLWILDAGNNTAMEPYRAFVADKLVEEQQPLGFQAQSFFTGFGQTLANLSLWVFPIFITTYSGPIPHWVYASFFLGAVCSIGSVWWSMRTTPEIEPTAEEIAKINAYNAGKPPVIIQFVSYILAMLTVPALLYLLLLPFLEQQTLNFLLLPILFLWIYLLYQILLRFSHISFIKAIKDAVSPLLEIVDAVKEMPSVMWHLALIYLFQWYALFCYWQNAAKAVALNIFDATPKDEVLFGEAVSLTGLINGWYNVVTFLVAFALVGLAKKFGAKWVHALCIGLAGIGLIIFSNSYNETILFAAITGFGIGWASMMGIPYLLVVSKIPKERYGVYMGIINAMIVIPMLIQTLTFGYIHKHFLNNDPTKAILFAGILLLIASLITLFMKSGKVDKNVAIPSAGH